MANVNVNRSVTDAFYRYKMPKIIAKVEGKGNGIKTVIVNMPEVAKSLSRPPTYPTKYFGCELGAQTQFDLKNERFIVNGAHDSSKLQDLLDNFIKRFVLCTECDNPETNLVVQVKKGMILQRCIACGHSSNIDMRHKLTTFILKNPPDMELLTSNTPQKKEKKKDKKSKKEVNGDSSPRGEDGDPDVESPPEPKSKSKAKAEDNDDDLDWGEDTSEAAVKARLLALSDAAKSLALTDDLEKSPQERLNLFFDYVKRRKEIDTLTGADKEIVAEADRLDVKDKAPLILVELLLDANILQQISQYRTHFLRFTHENKKAQKYLLGGVEQLVGTVHYETLMPKVAHILKKLYDADILEEDVLIDWGEKVSKKYVSKEIAAEIHEKAKPIITWLKEAEEESEDDDDSDDELEIVYDDKAEVGVTTVKPAAPAANSAAPAAAPAEEEDDLDIDAI